jgi:hypothetical protein
MIAAASLRLAAADLETQHGFDLSLPLRPKWELLLHSRARVATNGQGLYQFRSGPILSYEAHRRVTLLGGFYYNWQEARDNDFIGGQRVFGGAEFQAWENRNAELDVRTMVERFFPGEAADFNRYRTRFRLTAKRKVAPYASTELFFDEQGYRSGRFAAGLRWRTTSNLQLDFGYFFEERVARIGFDRHMIMTTVHFRRRSGKPADPDI